jgi:hypothetical protein
MVCEQLVLCQVDIVHSECIVYRFRVVDVLEQLIVEGLGIEDLTVSFLEAIF